MKRFDEKGEIYINSILKHQKSFKWQDIHPYNEFKNSFDYHVEKHPIKEHHTGKWDSLINYDNKETISSSYYKVSNDLPQKYVSGLKENYSLIFNNKHCSYNILDRSNNLMVCLKYKKDELYFYIATCYFPSYKIMRLFYQNEANGTYKKSDNLHYILYKEEINKNIDIFREAMEEFFGNNSTEYKILFENNITDDIDEIVNEIIADTTEFLNLMENIINNEEDKKFYFVFNDGIDYIIKLSLLYKIKNNNYEKLYNRFLNIDINNSYKEALDICKKFIDERENKND